MTRVDGEIVSEASSQLEDTVVHSLRITSRQIQAPAAPREKRVSSDEEEGRIVVVATRAMGTLIRALADRDADAAWRVSRRVREARSEAANMHNRRLVQRRQR